MKALILAAGQGIRLGSLTDGHPKGLVKVAGQELILHTLAFLRHPQITQIGCVIGFQAEKMRQFLREQAPQVQCFENKQFQAGNLLSLMAGFDFLDDDFLLMNVDHIYPQTILEKIVQSHDNITVACDFDRKLVADDMKVQQTCHSRAGGNPYLKAMDKKLESYDGGYIGMTFCPKAKLDLYREACQNTLKDRGEKVCVEGVLDCLAKQGEPIAIADMSGLRWHEVDTKEDAALAEQNLQ